MENFLWGTNPLKKKAVTGFRGYIIDTATGCWLSVEVFNKGKGELHNLKMIAGTGDGVQNQKVAFLANKWYLEMIPAKMVPLVETQVETAKLKSIDHFIWATGREKKLPVGLQGYIIDTVKGCWYEVSITGEGVAAIHTLKLISGTGDAKADMHSAQRASRWYNSWLIVRKVEDVEISVEMIIYAATDEQMEKAIVVGESARVIKMNS
jgi:hypothetical protein